MIGATVKVKEIPTLGTVSDADGNYSLSLEEGSYTIIFSFVGFTDNTQTITGKAGDNLVLDVDLEEDKELLDELVIIGYGESKKEDIAGAIVAVSSEEFNKGIITSPQQLLQGKVSGVQISANNGEPGSGMNLRIRGLNSLRGASGPLFVVDGIPISGNANPSVNVASLGTRASQNPLNFLNPADIKSIQVFKRCFCYGYLWFKRCEWSCINRDQWWRYRR